MSLRNLARLLSPARVAIVGGSDRPGTVGKVVVDNVIGGGFGGEVFVVNPRPQAIPGAQWVARIEDLPSAPDLAIVVTPARDAPSAIAQLGARGAPAAMVISTGITVENGLREAMLAAARPSGLRIVGPNGLGLIAPHAKLNAAFARGTPKRGGLALVSQSGALAAGLIDWADGRDLGFSAIISAGDMADVDFADLIDLLAADPHTDAILLYIEGVTDAARLLSAAHAATRNKPVIALKAGRTASARRAVASHTGAIAGDAAVHRRALERAGVVVVDDLSAFLDTAEVLSATARPHGHRLAIVTNGGGAGILALDAMADGPGEIATLAPATLEKLNAALPSAWSRGDPVDIVGDASAARYAAAIDAVLDDDGVDALLVANCPTALVIPGEIAERVADVIRAARARGRRQPVIGCWLGETNAQAAEPWLSEAGIPTFETPDAAIEAFHHLLRARASRTGLAAQPVALKPERAEAARALITEARAQGRSLLSEVEAKQILALYGITTIETRLATTAERVGEACAGLAAPYVVKVVSPQIPHKSDVGGVALDLSTPRAAVEAAREMSARLAGLRPDARIDGFAVETMARPGGYELIVGLTTDPIFGPVVAVGDGGKAVEVLADLALELPPLDHRLARAMIARTRISRLLTGYRDVPPADIDGVASALEAVSAMAIELNDLVELDINPLRVDSQGVVALDARIIITPKPSTSRMAIASAPPAAWARLTTRRGRAIDIRPAGPDDEALLATFFAGLSPEDLRLRFLSPVRTLDHERLAMMCALDYRRTMTFLAFDVDQEVVLATAMLAGGPDPDRAEVAVAVRSDLKGQGLGWILLDHALDYARSQGVQVVESVEAADNAPALQLEGEMGFSTRICPDDTGLRIVERRLAPSPRQDMTDISAA